jgi:tetratricopeptide (TPR) repeat protein
MIPYLAFFCLGWMILSNGRDDRASAQDSALLYKQPVETEGGNTKQPKYVAEQTIRWLTAVELHTPGESDTAAVTVGSWPIVELEDIVKLIKRLAKQKDITGILSSMDLLNEPLKGGTSQFRRFLDGPNQMLKRAALLHADIAMLQLDTGRVPFGSTQLLVEDGRGTPQGGGEHWEIARSLLDSITPNPSSDDMVRQWYIATSAYMFARRRWGNAETNLNRALEIFPTNARILFYAGVVHENYAMPESQTIHMQWMRARLGSKEAELKKAREFFKTSIEHDRGFAEAHLHLGRTMGSLEDHTGAAVELRQASAALTDPQLQYYCSLFLGNELAILSKREEARVQFERAAALFPNAQSPLLGLSQLARVSGDFNGASLAVQKIFKLPSGGSIPEDPWWVYDVSHVRNVSALISEMYREIGGLR